MRLFINKLFIIMTAVTLVGLFPACKTQEKAASETVSGDLEHREEALLQPIPTERPVYRAANTRHFDLIHTSLDVRFDWERQQLKGKAQLTLQPYFYATDKLVLDAKGFDLNTIGMKKDGQIKTLQYVYDGSKIFINLDREYRRDESIDIWIDYVAKPEEINQEGSAAIMDAKGLYFINPLSEDKDKPMQIWTQGETESSSCWFPTIDSPNENMTQDIKMTVDNRYITLSNGLLVSSKPNGDGTRTDHWKQTLPHAPYLAMMAVGEFAIVKDKWKGIDVDYYVEPDYEPYAKSIFGETPNMLEYYSDVLQYPYVWEKYSQIVVRDFVSGAMENTTATVHGEFLQRTDRELLDGDNERIIAHELFHHWFGDLVTCESWSNLPLNESFATYGEYMWFEHRHGRDAADEHGYGQLQEYMMAARQTGYLDLIRFHYEDKEDMFDSHSYAKGGRVLHMLRKTIGDEAFYKGLNLYLKQNEFKAVEIHQLRLAMEEITGQDLNWFFNQWFLDNGHPELGITHDYDPELKKYYVTIEQQQDLNEFPLYRIPMDVDIYFGGAVNRHRIDLTKLKETFEFDVLGEPSLVNVDAEKMLLGTKKEVKTIQEYIFQLKNAPLYLDRHEALDGMRNSSDQEAVLAVLDALEDPFWGIRYIAIRTIKSMTVTDTSLLKNRLIWMAQKDEKSSVRAEAIRLLTDMFSHDLNVKNVIEGAMNDPSYAVGGAVLKAISAYDTDKAIAVAKQLETDANGPMVSSIASLYSINGGPECMPFFLSSIDKVTDPNDKYVFVQIFGKYLIKQDYDSQLQGIPILENLALNEGAWWMRLSAIQVVAGLRQASEKSEDQKAKLLTEKAKAILSKVKASESNPMILNMIGG